MFTVNYHDRSLYAKDLPIELTLNKDGVSSNRTPYYTLRIGELTIFISPERLKLLSNIIYKETGIAHQPLFYDGQ
jgi:hypothetical protein